MSSQVGVQGTKTDEGHWLIECTQHGPIAVLRPHEPPDDNATAEEAKEIGRFHLRTAHPDIRRVE